MEILGSSCCQSPKLPLSCHNRLLSSPLFVNTEGTGFLDSTICDVHVGKFKILRKRCPKTKRFLTTSVLPDVAKDFMIFQEERFATSVADPKTVASIILGGGAGTRLFPLTQRRAKPAVPIGGCYRLIDVPMSNCINSGINKIFILTQFNSRSLNQHIVRTYNLGNGVHFGNGFIEVLAATQTPGEWGKKWFQGTADAVRQFIWLFEDAKHRHIENILILSGDHLYQMDYMDFLQKHIDSGADVSVCCLPVDNCRASDYGLVKIDERGRIIEFQEKPKGECLRSMLPLAAKDYNVRAYLFNGYWEDIGTIKSFFDANLALTEQPPKLHLYDPLKPIFTSPRFLPPTKIERCQIRDSIISHGCFLRECTVEHSIVGIRSRLEQGVVLKDTLMMGADDYETQEELATHLTEGKVPIGVGRYTKIMNCIIDMNARIGKNVIIYNKDNVEEADRPSEGFYIRSGITVITKNSMIRDGTII
ncbi:glucose-1-phosphate adenylyltransferase large subunit 2, chloroplastic-like [Carica papaya]|uniref:glucose-1-phosphate adenylyltransferase large subunit 2, chloroplastic-like n=1 Tax=Carica papaya TaxID=3649 RepID=UPI000B8CFDAA|nr:glucose-1-phosphate adenylyltransferase large subunit 2, chloroplastic-like [Carica papaya]